MQRRVYIGVALAVAVLLLAIWIYPREPSYNGKSLSDWIVSMRNARDPGDKQEARAAVHQLASNSIPLLLEWLQRKERPSLRARYWQAKDSAVSWLEAHRLITPKPHNVLMDWKGNYRLLAQWAFEELGADGKAAIPTLIKWLGKKASSTNEPDEAAGAAYRVLIKMAPASIPALTVALSSQDDQVWVLAGAALANIGPDAKTAIPALRPKLQDANHLTRVTAANMIGKLGGEPQEFVPVLIQSLREPGDADMFGYKLDVLLQHKENARNALPTLFELLRGVPHSIAFTNGPIRDQVLFAIREIGKFAPESVQATNAVESDAR